MREKASEIVMKCLGEKKLSQSQLAARMGEDVRVLNQQLHRQNDMKVGRFSDVLEHAGYRMEVVDNDGIQLVCHEFAKRVVETGKPSGRFCTFCEGVYTGIDNQDGDIRTKEFGSYDECMEWLRQEADDTGKPGEA